MRRRRVGQRLGDRRRASNGFRGTSRLTERVEADRSVLVAALQSAFECRLGPAQLTTLRQDCAEARGR
jgi:hypothetical protein